MPGGDHRPRRPFRGQEAARDVAGRVRHLVDAVGVEQRLVEVVGVAMVAERSEEHTSELQSLMRISYAVFCLKKKTEFTSPDQIQQHITIKDTTAQAIVQ